MSEVFCNVYVLFNCLYVCFCFSLYLYCICCIEEALMLAIDQPLPPIENTDLPAAILRHPIYTRWTPPSVRLTADLISKTCKENLCPSIFWCGILRHLVRWVERCHFFVEQDQVSMVHATDWSSKTGRCDFQAIAQLQIFRWAPMIYTVL